MKAEKHFKIATIAVMLLGLIHISATSVIFPFFKADKQIDPASVYMFVLVGLYTIFTGWLQYYILKRINADKAFLNILKVTILFLGISGIGAVATMWDNPFAYIILLIALYELISYRFLRYTLM